MTTSTLHTKLVILDLDETLIHATQFPPNNQWDFEVYGYKVFMRPGLNEFLSFLRAHFKVAVWSSAADVYVNRIVERIFPNDYPLEFIWGRSKCTLHVSRQFIDMYGSTDSNNHLHYVKPLKKVKNDGYGNLEDMLIIDDTPTKSLFNYGNAIYPEPYLAAQEDDELPLLAKYLITLKDVANVRKIEKRNWKQEI